MSSFVLAVSACGGGEKDDEDNGTTGGSITVNSCNPPSPLIPANTTKACGGSVLDLVTAKLMRYQVDDATPEYDIAESIETEDNQAFTVKLKKDYRFSDGTPVLAENLVNAWNFAAYGPNEYEAAYFFEPIEGWEQLQCTGRGDDPCARPGDRPKVKALSGLKIIDELTFTIETTTKVSKLEARLGYLAFAPMPDSFFGDPEAYGLQPVTAGPYAVDRWTAHEEIVLKRNPHYSGAFGGKVDQIVFRIYTDPSEGYTAARDGEIDLVDVIPQGSLSGDAWTKDFPGRTFSREVAAVQTIGLNPTADPALADVRIRKAISMAIDRPAIIEECGHACTFNPVEAKRLFKAAGGYPGPKLTVAYDAGSADHDWIGSVCDSIRRTLGIGCGGKAYDDLTTARKRQVHGLFSAIQRIDYPNAEVTTGFTTIPLWYDVGHVAWSERIDNVTLNAFGVPDYASITVK